MAGVATHVRVTDAPDTRRWAAFVAGHPKGSVFHTPQMHEVHARTRRYRPLTLAAVGSDGDLVALVCAVRVATLPAALGPVASRSVHYAEPLCRPGAGPALARLMREHDRRMAARTVFSEIRPLEAPGEERAALESEGHRWEPYLNFVIDLGRGEDAVWEDFTRTTRKKIRRSRKEGVTVEEDDGPRGVAALDVLSRDVYRRSQVPRADVSLFHAAREILVPAGMSRTFVARLDGEVVGAHCVLVANGRAFAWYWANVRTPGLHVQEQLIWHALRWSRGIGCTVYDMGGAGRPDEPYGPREFKRQFGGEEVCFGRYRRVWSPRRMAAAEGAYELLRHRVVPFARRAVSRLAGSPPPAIADPPGPG